MPTSQTACTCHSMDKAGQQKGNVALRFLVAPSSFSDKVPNHLWLHLCPELEDHPWQDTGQCCCPSSVFSEGIKAVGILLSTPQSLIRCLYFFFSFFRRGRVLGLEGREECIALQGREEGVFCFVEHDLLSH